MRKTLLEPKTKHVDLYVGLTDENTGESFRLITQSGISITFHWKIETHCDGQFHQTISDSQDRSHALTHLIFRTPFENPFYLT